MNLKALEILKNNKIVQKNVEPNYLREAIKELEDLGNKMTRSDAKQEVIEMFKTIPFSQLKIGDINNIIDKIYDNFENK